MKCKRKAVVFFGIITLSLLTVVVGCKKSSSVEDPIGSLITGAFECKKWDLNAKVEGTFGAINTTCVSYQYDGQGTLKMKHVNAGFNCCPGALSATIDFNGNTITITEAEQDAACHCLCLFDLDFEIVNLKAGTYTIKFVEPYWTNSAESLEFTINLNGAKSGEYCMERNDYPWGTNEID